MTRGAPASPRPHRRYAHHTPHPATASTAPGEASYNRTKSSRPRSRNGSVHVRNPTGSGITSAAPPEATAGTRTSATTAVTVQLPSVIRCPKGAKPSASAVRPSTANRLRNPTPWMRRAHAQPTTSSAVTVSGTSTHSTAVGSTACGTAANTALGRWRKCGSAYGEPPSSRVRAARTPIALSIPPSGPRRATSTTGAHSTTPSTSHACQEA